MYRASIQMRHSKIDQEELAHKIAEWLQESPQDIFLLRPSMKSASDIFESAQKQSTSQNNVRKPQTALKLPQNSKYRKSLGFVKLQYGNLIKIKIPTKPHQKSSNTTSPQTLTPRSKCVTGG